MIINGDGGVQRYDMGRYHHRLVFQSRVSSLNEYGEKDPDNWETLELTDTGDKGVWGMVREIPRGQAEVQLSGRETPLAEVQIEVLYRPEINSDEALRIIHQDMGVLYDIIRLENPLFANEILIFHCQRNSLKNQLALLTFDEDEIGGFGGGKLGGF